MARSQGSFHLWQDTKQSLNYMLEASHQQFKTRSNLYYLGAAIPSMYYSFEEDQRITDHAIASSIDNLTDVIGSSGTFFTFPFLSLGMWSLAKYTDDQHFKQFVMEYTATLYLTLIESGLLSFVPIHERPQTHDLNFWEKNFRGDSSWPSGHLIPFTSLFFKTFQFYGPYWSLLPLGVTVLAAKQRVASGKHWFSDVIGSFFITAFASEGVRAAAGYQGNHRFYKWAFEHDLQVSFIKRNSVWVPRVSWRF